MNIRTISVLSTALMLCGLTQAAFAQQAPTPAEVKKVMSYYYEAEGQAPILSEIKFCTDIYQEGDEKNNCQDEVDPATITEGASLYIWMNFFVPQGTEAKILAQLSHKGITRDTHQTNIRTSIRYRSWWKVDFSKEGEWGIKVFYESDDDVKELYSTTVTVGPAAETQTEAAEPAESGL